MSELAINIPFLHFFCYPQSFALLDTSSLFLPLSIFLSVLVLFSLMTR